MKMQAHWREAAERLGEVTVVMTRVVTPMATVSLPGQRSWERNLLPQGSRGVSHPLVRAGAPPDPDDDRPLGRAPRSAAGSRPRYAPHRNLTLQRVARGDAAAGVRRPAGALPRRYVACGAGKGSRVQHDDPRPHDDRKVASTTYVAPRRRWAGSNTDSWRLCAT
jgi:hypothetical protein